MNEIIKHTKDLIKKDFDLEIKSDSISEEELIKLLAIELEFLIDRRMEYLFQILYRLDVNEGKVNDALGLTHDEPAHIALAKLIVERQKKKAETRIKYSSPDIDDEDWF